MTFHRTLLAMLVAVGAIGTQAHIARAQWSIGAPGARQAPADKHRYVYAVFSNPTPGREAEFNSWYDNTHMGDLIQLPGVTGGQRFRIVSTLQPRPTRAGYDFGYVVLWDEEDIDAQAVPGRMLQAIRGGKTRLSPAFGSSLSVSYEAVGPRITRPDGLKPFMPDAGDPKTPRPNRYLVLDFTDPGAEKPSDAAAESRIRDILSVHGWMAAQRFKLVASTTGLRTEGPPALLTMWEVEGDAQSAQNSLVAAVQAGRVRNPNLVNDKAQFVYWEPITPYITRDAFSR